MTPHDLVMSAAGTSVGGVGGSSPTLYVDDVFSTYLYTGNGGTQAINNGIDLAGQGGMVWIKSRSGTYDHQITDTTDFGTMRSSNLTNFDTWVGAIYNKSSTGFSVQSAGTGAYNVNRSTETFSSWTFRKAPKFFDVVTFSGNNVNGRNVSHALGSAPGMVIVKRIDSLGDWWTWHTSTTQSNQRALQLNTTAANNVYGRNIWGPLGGTPSMTSTTFSVGDDTNITGGIYVAYLFAHDTSTDGLIQCGSYTGNGSDTSGPTVNLGWEPQFLIVKRATIAEDWFMMDSMRGMSVNGMGGYFKPNGGGIENSVANQFWALTSTGFEVKNTFNAGANTSGEQYIYMAIRRPNKPPTSGTQVFDISTSMSGSVKPAFDSSILVDMSMMRRPAYVQDTHIASRVTGEKNLYTNLTDAEVNQVENIWSYMKGWGSWNVDNPDYFSLNFKRAPGFFDVTTWLGNSQSVGVDYFKIQPHNLGAAPEFVIIKNRGTTWDWWCYHRGCTKSTSGLKEQYVIRLNSSAAEIQLYGDEEGTLIPDVRNFYLPNGLQLNQTGYNYVAYLFATLAGISKVGKYTGNGSSQTVNCGFAAGARFILIKRTDSAGDWYVWNTTRGIIGANDPHLTLNTTVAEVTTDDSIDPDNTGFIVNQVAATNINVTSATYIFLAIA